MRERVGRHFVVITLISELVNDCEILADTLMNKFYLLDGGDILEQQLELMSTFNEVETEKQLTRTWYVKSAPTGHTTRMESKKTTALPGALASAWRKLRPSWTVIKYRCRAEVIIISRVAMV